MSGYAQLTERQRCLIELYFNEFELSQAEIARRLDSPAPRMGKAS